MTPENDFQVTKSYVKATFEYRNGALYWKKSDRQTVQWNAHYAGKPAGTTDAKGYVNLQIKDPNSGVRRKLQAHRLIYLLHHNESPEIVDHINGNPSDNRIENLRAAEPYQNAANRKVRTDSSTGCLGVSRHRRDGTFAVQIMFAKTRHWIGTFQNLEDARMAAEAARERIVGEWRRAT